MSLPYIIVAIFCPVMGLLIDRYGKRTFLLILASILISIGFFLLPIVYPVYTFILLGISYAIFASVIWPTVAYLVPNKKIVSKQINIYFINAISI